MFGVSLNGDRAGQVIGWIEISFTTCTRRFFLEPSFKTHYAYYSYSIPDPVPWQYSNTIGKNTLGFEIGFHIQQAQYL
ncbi:hypothetical protein VN97_g12184, partial [Penicillium thymicola]